MEEFGWQIICQRFSGKKRFKTYHRKLHHTLHCMQRKLSLHFTLGALSRKGGTRGVKTVSIVRQAGPSPSVTELVTKGEREGSPRAGARFSHGHPDRYNAFLFSPVAVEWPRHCTGPKWSTKWSRRPFWSKRPHPELNFGSLWP